MRTTIIAMALSALALTGCATQPPPPPVVIVKHDLAPQPKPVAPPDPYINLRPRVAWAIQHDTNETIQDGITTIWPYSPDIEWTVDCQPLRTTEIILDRGETTDKDNVLLGDTVRWLVRVGNGAVLVEPLGTNQTIVGLGPQPMVIPPDPAMATNLVIHTSKRDYHLLLRLHKRDFMGAVGWYYATQVKEAEAARIAFSKGAQ